VTYTLSTKLPEVTVPSMNTGGLPALADGHVLSWPGPTLRRAHPFGPVTAELPRAMAVWFCISYICKFLVEGGNADQSVTVSLTAAPSFGRAFGFSYPSPHTATVMFSVPVVTVVGLFPCGLVWKNTNCREPVAEELGCIHATARLVPPMLVVALR